ncbi:MAG: methyltransferase, FkbM family [Bryobacterales bacterium]|jgi:FkbM family methyltransferase|nr:methyltransferase, FkbM family [Bryobacterales bacterium]
MSLAEFVYTVLLRPKGLKSGANWLIRRMLPKRLQYHGVILALNPRDPVVSGALLFRVYENAELRVYEHLLEPGMIVVDVGANVGLYSAIAAQRVGASGRVIALEPDPESFQFLLRTIQHNGFHNIEPHQMAASAHAGTTPLFRNPDNRGDSRLYRDPMLKDSVDVTTVALDDLLVQKGIQQVDFMKIDVQGAEGLVLAGARETLRRSTSLTLMMEFWPYGLSRTGHDPKAILNELHAYGFALFETAEDLRPLPASRDWDELIARNSGRRYTNLLARKSLQPLREDVL